MRRRKKKKSTNVAPVVFILVSVVFQCEINFISKEIKQILVNPDICTRKEEEQQQINITPKMSMVHNGLCTFYKKRICP